MELILLRHGIPVEPEQWAGAEIARPLTPSGHSQTIAAIEGLVRARRLAVDAVWSSPYARCEQTARIAAVALGLPVLLTPALASGADLVASLPKHHGNPSSWPARLLCVGHSPDLGNLIGALVGGAPQALGRCGSALIQGRFAPGGMKLEWLLSANAAVGLG